MTIKMKIKIDKEKCIGCGLCEGIYGGIFRIGDDGKAFCVDGSCGNSMRLNFSYPTDEQIDEGMKRLGIVIEKNL